MTTFVKLLLLGTMISFNDLKKNLKKDFTSFKKIKIAIVADNASQLLSNAIKAYGYIAQVDYEIYEAEYNQIDLQVFDPSSELYKFQPDFIFINKSTENILSDFYKTDVSQRKDFADHIADITRKYCDAIGAKLQSKIIINTLPEINDGILGNFAAKFEASSLYQIRKINFLLAQFAQQYKNVLICDVASLYATLGNAFVFDSKMYFNASMVYSLDFLPYIAKHITDIVLSTIGLFKKCVIFDLDNTIWGGIIGDDGIEGIQIGHLGSGKIYTELQLWAKELKHRGIILAICSKNTENIALEPFKSHPDMILKPEDIAVFVANWETKVNNIKYIQSVLNIGFDSMVFIDDNPFEREMVRNGISDITVPELPDDPSEYLIYLRSLNLFETCSFTEEDVQRTQQYQVEAQRNVLRLNFDNEDDFLLNLGMTCTVEKFNSFSIPRVAQLSQRSNQFNLRTVRYTEDELLKLSGSDEYYSFSLSLKDRLGNHGLIGIIILKKENRDTVFIDSWIMSCRVLKRGMENFTLNTIVEWAKDNEVKEIVGEYIPTKKNGIVKNHYEDLGFKYADGKWVLDVNTYAYKKSFIEKVLYE